MGTAVSIAPALNRDIITEIVRHAPWHALNALKRTCRAAAEAPTQDYSIVWWEPMPTGNDPQMTVRHSRLPNSRGTISVIHDGATRLTFDVDYATHTPLSWRAGQYHGDFRASFATGSDHNLVVSVQDRKMTSYWTRGWSPMIIALANTKAWLISSSRQADIAMLIASCSGLTEEQCMLLALDI